MRRKRKIDKDALKKKIRSAIEFILEDEVFMSELENKFVEPGKIIKRIEKDVAEIVKNAVHMFKGEYEQYIQEKMRELKEKYIKDEE